MSTETTTAKPELTIYAQLPKIKGTVTESKHKDWVELSHVGYNIKRHFQMKTGHVANVEMTKPEFSSVTVSKSLDASGPLLAQEACTGKAMDKVTLHFCKTGAKGLVTLQEITLKDVYLSRYSVDTANNNHRAHEHFDLNFSNIEIKGTSYDATGAQQTPNTFAYDLGKAEAC